MRVGFEIGSGTAGVLLLHGLTGTPEEVRPLGEALGRRGFRCLGPWLAGHGSSPRLLGRTSWRDWEASAREAYGRLWRQCRTVALVGLSMGGLLALRLAVRVPTSALAVFGVPVWIRDPRFAGLAFFRFLQRRVRDLGGGVRDPRAPYHLTYPWVSSDSLYEMKKLQGRVREALSEVRVPVLVGHGARDTLVPPKNGPCLHRALTQAPVRRLRRYPRSDHVVTLDYDRKRVVQDVVDFLWKWGRND